MHKVCKEIFATYLHTTIPSHNLRLKVVFIFQSFVAITVSVYLNIVYLNDDGLDGSLLNSEQELKPEQIFVMNL